MNPSVYFVENLSVKVWLSSILPYLLKHRIKGRKTPLDCHVFNGSKLSLIIGRLTGWTVGVSVKRLEFRLLDVRDEDGRLMRLRIAHHDLFQIQKYIAYEPLFQDLINSGKLTQRLPVFLIKTIVDGAVAQPGTLWRTLFLIQVCNWKSRVEDHAESHKTLFLERRLWHESICRYASEYNVSIVPVQTVTPLRTAIRRRLPAPAINFLRYIRFKVVRPASAIFNPKISAKPPETSRVINDPKPIDSLIPISQVTDDHPLVAVDIYGQFNLDHPELHSDLFFWHQSSLRGEDMLLTFANPHDPIDKVKFAALSRQGMKSVALSPGAATVSEVPVFSRSVASMELTAERTYTIESLQNSPEGVSLTRKLADYQSIRDYWSNLFNHFNTKVYVTWYKFDGNHCAIADALEKLGGITAIYQRSYQPYPYPQATVSADLSFVYSQSMSEVERSSDSEIRYLITTGYLGDHRIPLLRERSGSVRHQLKSNGATHILAFFDENSAEDTRWNTGHNLVRENYEFLLEKVLTEPWLGLIIKPKNPGSLRRRLGPEAELLNRAIATGRCFVYEAGILQGFHTPVEAALEADLVVHGHLCAATAGMEAALAGVPTLLMDREGCTESPINQLGIGNVIFKDWEEMWEACSRNWFKDGGLPGFGDWSLMLEELDPFRDGRAAERMGEYLRWMIDGFKQGVDREKIMADAAERYCVAWGTDKITEIRSHRQVSAQTNLESFTTS